MNRKEQHTNSGDGDSDTRAPEKYNQSGVGSLSDKVGLYENSCNLDCRKSLSNTLDNHKCKTPLNGIVSKQVYHEDFKSQGKTEEHHSEHRENCNGDELGESGPSSLKNEHFGDFEINSEYSDKVDEICETEQSGLLNISKLSIQTEMEPDILNGIEYVVYQSEHQMPDIMRLITKDLSEPYSIYTYRYFIHNWPKLCFLAMDREKCVGAIVCKLDLHKKIVRRGYIAMLAVDKEYRRRKIGSHLVLKAITGMITDDCDEVVLETEITNKGALHLYENLGFVRDKRLFRYYLNGVDALRLKLWLR